MENKELNKLIIQIAKGAIYSKLYDTDVINKDELVKKVPNFLKRGATFVTISLDGDLRGCIGSLVAHKTLLDDLLINATKAAFEDPRFPPLTKEEFENIKIEVSLLSQPLPMPYINFGDLKQKLIPNKHGVIIRLEDKQATFLPQVWEELPDFETFIYHLYVKAGLDVNNPTQAPEVFTYTVEKIEE